MYHTVSHTEGNGKAQVDRIVHLVPRIAVVDSSSESRDGLRDSLRDQSFETRAFACGATFVESMLQHSQVDVAIIDLHLDDVSGWSLVRQMRMGLAGETGRTLPVILKSDLFCAELVRGISLKAGADVYIQGPVTGSELSETIDQILLGRASFAQRKHLIVSRSGHSELTTLLRRAGFENTVVSDLAEARLRLRTYSPDMVLVEDELAQELALSEEVHLSRATFMIVSPEPGKTRSGPTLAPYAGILRWPDEPSLALSILSTSHRAHSLWQLPHRWHTEQRDFQADPETFRLLLDSIPDAALMVDAQGNILDVNKSCLTSLGCQKVHLLGRQATDYFTTPDLEVMSFDRLWEEATDSPEDIEVICTRLNGTTFHALASTSRLLHFHGKRAMIVFLRDKSMEQSAQQAVKISEAKLKIIADNTYDWEFWRSPHGHFLYSSPACEKICGYHHREFEMQPDFLASIILPSDHAELPEPEESCYPDEPVNRHFRIVTKVGQIRWVHYSSRPIYDESGNILGRRGNLRDVTDEHQVAREREALGTAVEQSHEAIGISNLKGMIEYANPAFRTLFEWSPRARVRKPIPKGRWKKIFKSLENGESWTGWLQRQSKPGKILKLQVSLSPIRDGAGTVRQISWVVRDVTAETELRERLQTAERMDSLGKLAGGLAHDFNNLLAGILGQAALMAEVGSDPRVKQAADLIATAAGRASELTKKLLGFAREGKEAHQAFSLHQALEEAASLLACTNPKDTNLEWHLGAHCAWIDGDPSQISQVLINLTINAFHALDKPLKTVSYETENAIDSETGKEVIHLRIRDNGCGMTKQTLQRVFEPFFTTKASGSGLGLSMVYGIVNNHAGKISVESESGVGTVFQLTFPTTTQRPPEKTSDPTTEPPVRQPNKNGQAAGRILIIDDEEMVRITLSRLLDRMGYQVDVREDATTGIDYYAHHWQEVGMVICDMHMPEVDGLECFEKLQLINPDVKVALTTGDTRPETVRKALQRGIVDVLPKPFKSQNLSQMIAQHLDNIATEAT